MYIYRPNRGGLKESMLECKRFKHFSDMAKHIKKELENSGIYVELNSIKITSGMKTTYDARNGWADSVYVVANIDSSSLFPQCVGICATRVNESVMKKYMDSIKISN